MGIFSGHWEGDFSSYTGSILEAWERGINGQKQLEGLNEWCRLRGL